MTRGFAQLGAGKNVDMAAITMRRARAPTFQSVPEKT